MPRCHSYLSPVIKMRPGKTEPGQSPNTVRALIATPCCLLLGVVLIAVGYARMGDRGAVLWARVFVFGILMIIAGALSLVTTVVGIRKTCRMSERRQHDGGPGGAAAAAQLLQ